MISNRNTKIKTAEQPTLKKQRKKRRKKTNKQQLKNKMDNDANK